MRKRSARLDEPFVFFVDRCLGKHTVPDALRLAVAPNERVEAHDDHFPQDATDGEWLVEVGRRGWVAFSQDRNILRNPLEQNAILAAQVAFVGVGRAHAPAANIAETLIAALPSIRRSLRRFRVRLIATVTLQAEVLVRWDGGERLAVPSRLRPPGRKA